MKIFEKKCMMLHFLIFFEFFSIFLFFSLDMHKKYGIIMGSAEENDQSSDIKMFLGVETNVFFSKKRKY